MIALGTHSGVVVQGDGAEDFAPVHSLVVSAMTTAGEAQTLLGRPTVAVADSRRLVGRMDPTKSLGNTCGR